MKLDRSVIAFVVVSASVAACSATTSQEEDTLASEHTIVGGAVAQAGAWPSAAALYKGSTQVCGGSLVADEWVITAAHCLSSSTTGGFSKVVIGRHDLTTSGGETITVKKAFRHAGYNSATLDNDIALLQLNAKSTATPATLITAAQAAALTAGSMVTVVGWGLTSQSGSASNKLREVSVPIIGNTECAAFPQYDVTQNMICAGLSQGGKDSCQGDSGGPLFMKIAGTTTQVGIVSWGIGCAQPDAPGVYTRISNYLAWLAQTSNGAVGGAAPPPPPPPPDGGTPPPTFAGFEESGSVTKDQEKSFSYDAPAGTFEIALTGTNDADLYVKANAPATVSTWDCRPYENGSEETCQVTLTAAGKLHVMVRGWATGSSSFTVKGSMP